jgi:hypothetical protein
MPIGKGEIIQKNEVNIYFFFSIISEKYNLYLGIYLHIEIIYNDRGLF